MAEQARSLEDLKSALKQADAPVVAATEDTVLAEPKIGRAWPRLCHRQAQRTPLPVSGSKPGAGKIVVNGREQEVYFARPVLRMMLAQPFETAERLDQYDVFATVTGGGLSGQAGAVRHGISKALTYYEPALRGVLKAGGFLTRDSRVVERKKYGKKKARRSFQFLEALGFGSRVSAGPCRSYETGGASGCRPLSFGA